VIKAEAWPKSGTASIQDRGVAEADELLGRLPDLARAARSRGLVS
jgi:hypothetical protein